MINMIQQHQIICKFVMSYILGFKFPLNEKMWYLERVYCDSLAISSITVYTAAWV